MDDQNLKQSVENIERNVEYINSRIGGGWTALWRGILTGLGYVMGAFVAILIIGYFLNFIGFIPALKQQAEAWRQTLQGVQRK